MMRLMWLALGALAVCTGSALAAPDCSVNFSYFVFGSDFQKEMVVRSGKPCSSGFNIRGGGITSMVVAQPAAHGIAAVAGTRKWAYKSQPGYVGVDRFVIRIAGETIGRFIQSGQSNIEVNVRVVP